jgi:hypothetical protein
MTRLVLLDCNDRDWQQVPLLDENEIVVLAVDKWLNKTKLGIVAHEHFHQTEKWLKQVSQNRVHSDWIAEILARREEQEEETSRRTVLRKWLDLPRDSVPCWDVFPLDR